MTSRLRRSRACVARVKALLAEQQRQPHRAARRRQGVPGAASPARCWRWCRRCCWRAGWARFEFGIYIYVWTWVLMIGASSDVGPVLGRAPLHSGIHRAQIVRPAARLPDRQQWLAFGVATAHRRARRARRDAAVAACIDDFRSCRFISPASSSRSTAWCRSRPASRNPTTGRIWRWRRSTSGASSRSPRWSAPAGCSAPRPTR